MTRINTNIAAIRAMSDLSRSNKSLSVSLERLSTGFQINRASDAPAGLIISERLRTQIASLHQAVDNTERAINVLQTAESALGEVNSLLIQLQDLILESANAGAVSDEEILANQAQVDSAVQTITRIANTSSFAGIHLLDGSRDYQTSGVPRGSISEMKIYGAQITNISSSLAVTVTVTQNASQAIISNTASGIGTSGATLLISGNVGSQALKFNPNAANSAILAAVNSVANNTGVNGILSGGTMFFQSQKFGVEEFVSVVDLQNLSSSTQYINETDYGRDQTANINGAVADSRGLTVQVDSFNLKAELTLSSNFYANHTNNSAFTTSATATFYITGGGFAFNIGESTTDNNKAFVGIQRATADNLGDRSVGFLNDIVTGGTYSLRKNPEQAKQIVEFAIDDVSNLRARLGATTANTFTTNINSLDEELRNLIESESRIRDTDFAKETTEFTKNQILVQAGTSVLAQTNTAPQIVLQLLGQ